jgi:Rab5 GDP/GTP exchange factor
MEAKPEATTVLEGEPHPAPITPISPPANPWDVRAEQESDSERPGLHTPDASTLDHSITESIAVESPTEEYTTTVQPPPPEDVLNQFDPLSNPEEQEARDAWASAEGHPPPRTPSPPPVPPLKDTLSPTSASPESPLSSGGSTSSFQSFAAFAQRTFSIPGLSSRNRPSSMHSAQAVPHLSPNSMSNFVQQQQSGEAQAPSQETETSSSTDAAGSDKDPSAFDFQKFLDQMKSKNAEPVAKYLKS